MSIRTLLVGSLLTLVGILSGCGRGTNKTQIAFISNNPHGFWTYAQRGCEAAEKDLNGKGFNLKVEFKRPPEKGGAPAQQAIIEDLMAKGFKGIAVSPSDPGALGSFLKNKVTGKMSVIAADNDLLDTGARKVYIGTNNYQAGRAAGELIAKVLPKGGKIAIFVGVMDATNAKERRQGVLDYLAGRPDQKEMTHQDPATARNLKLGSSNYVLVDTRTDDESEARCRELAEDLLLNNPDVDCLVGLWEYNPPALLKARQSFKGAKKPFIVAFDENFQTMDGIKSGDIVGSIAQNPYKFGYDSVKILAHLIKGDESVLKEYTVVDQNRIYIEHTVVNTANVDEFYANLKKLRGE